MSAYDTQAEGRTDTEHATIVEEGPRWKGPFTEYDKYGEPTGERFVRCTGCGVEVLAGDTRHAARDPLGRVRRFRRVTTHVEGHRDPISRC